uniref:Uncharacterized protein n=1 Tax=Callorhinchus milii TaxID=7868 RepID=A0A4W3GAB8_CALMI
GTNGAQQRPISSLTDSNHRLRARSSGDRKESYSIHVFKDMNSFVNDIFERNAPMACPLAQYNKRSTIKYIFRQGSLVLPQTMSLECVREMCSDYLFKGH